MGDVQATAGGRSSSVSRGCRPVSSVASLSSSRHPRPRAEGPRLLHVACPWMLGSSPSLTIERRSEESRVGKEGVSTCRFRGSLWHEKKKKKKDRIQS